MENIPCLCSAFTLERGTERGNVKFRHRGVHMLILLTSFCPSLSQNELFEELVGATSDDDLLNV